MQHWIDISPIPTVMGANIELWQYKLYENGVLQVEEIHSRSDGESVSQSESESGKNPIMVAAGRKAAQTRKNASYTIDKHLQNLPPDLLELFEETRDFIVSLDSSVEEIPKKYYIAYRTSQNFVCLQTYRKKLQLFLKLNPSEYEPLPPLSRDVSNIGHFATGDYELTLRTREDFERNKWLVEEAYRVIGG